MTNTIQKYATPVIVPAQGGRTPVETTDGLPGYQPQLVGGFFPTAEYMAAYTYTNPEGLLDRYPAGADYRLLYGLLRQTISRGAHEITQLVENNLRGQYNPHLPYVYIQNRFNTWNPATDIQPFAPTSPELYLQFFSSAWDAGGATTSGFEYGQFDFSVSGSAVAAVGVSSQASDVRDPHALPFGMLFGYGASNTVWAIEAGALTLLTSSRVPTDVYALRIVPGAAIYYINSTAVRTVVLPPRVRATTYHGGAALYSPTAQVEALALTQFAGAATALPALCMRERAARLVLPAPTMSAGWLPHAALTLPAARLHAGDEPYAYAEMRLPSLGVAARDDPDLGLPRLTLVAGSYTAGAMRLPGLSVRGADYPFASVVATLPRITMYAYAGRPQFQGALLVLPRVRGAASGSAGSSSSAALTLPAMRGRSAYYSAAAMTLPKAQLHAYHDPASEAFISAAPFSAPAITSTLILLVSIDSAGTVAGVGSAQLVFDGQMFSAADAAGAMSTDAVMLAVMNSELVGASFTPLSEQGGETWVINADTGASSAYENYAFNSFGHVGGKMYGMRGDGLYLMEGNTDAGLPIRASVAFGSTDFKTAMLKRMEAIHIGVASTGTMYAKVLYKGQEYIYAARRSDDFMAVQRIDVGRGITASYLAFEMYNSDGCDFELNTVSFRAAVLTRRI